MTIADYLSRIPRTKRDIALLAGIAVRDVEALVQQARLEGTAICSDASGYWLSADPAEVRECALALRRRLAHQAITARAMLRTARRMESARELRLWP